MFDEKFETNGNGKSNGKDSGKGKGGKAGPAKKEPPQVLLKVEEELPENAKCLMNCEAAQILQGIQDHMVLLSKDPTIKIPRSLKKQDVSDGEICVIANTGIDTTEKAFALMPSLKAKQIKVIEPLSAALTELTKLKESTIVLD
ncbi:putative HRDC-like superfamily, Rpb4/RPC9 superfamily protein [Helianthus annuus]|nr:putative HRDC-like superfamily, Rpb4/RPC9 superfamily protein [Helianthus annuus]